MKLLSNYVQLEDPSQIMSPNPIDREMWSNVFLTTIVKYGSTPSKNYSKDERSRKESSTESFLVRGIVDRIDLVRIKSNYDENVYLRIIDYKTGKAPNFIYTPEMNQQIEDKTCFQLKIYALLLRELIHKRQYQNGGGAQIRFLC